MLSRQNTEIDTEHTSWRAPSFLVVLPTSLEAPSPFTSTGSTASRAFHICSTRQGVECGIPGSDLFRHSQSDGVAYSELSTYIETRAYVPNPLQKLARGSPLLVHPISVGPISTH